MVVWVDGWMVGWLVVGWDGWMVGWLDEWLDGVVGWDVSLLLSRLSLCLGLCFSPLSLCVSASAVSPSLLSLALSLCCYQPKMKRHT